MVDFESGGAEAKVCRFQALGCTSLTVWLRVLGFRVSGFRV